MAGIRSPKKHERAAPDGREQTVQLKIELETSKVDGLVALGYLRQVEREDPKQIRAALYWLLDRTLKSNVTSIHTKLND